MAASAGVDDSGMPQGLVGAEDAPDPRLYNADLAPVEPARRTWTTYNYIALWFSMSMEVTTYMLAASLIAGGMNWKQAIFTILLGNLIVLVPMLLNAHAGAKYGIPFPVFVRAPFGPVGANIPAILRAIVACGWFGIQSWIGGQAIFAMVNVLAPRTVGMPGVLWVCFLGFWALNMVVVWRGVESIRWLQSVSVPFMIVMSGLLLGFMLHKAGGFGPMLSAPSRFASRGEFLRFFFPSLTAIVGYWATLSLNIPDFTRYAKSQESQIVGQGFGLPVAMVLYSMFGIAVTSASGAVFGKPIWNPVELLARFHQPLVAFLGLIALLVATLNVNVGANVVGPSNDFSNLAPKYISFRTGGLITGCLGVAMMPWKLMATFGSYLFNWLEGYSGLLGPVAGIMVADYFLIRGTKLDTHSLYRRGGEYEYRNGVNPRAIVALVVGVVAALIGRFVPRVAFLYSYAWFIGFFVSGAVYALLMIRQRARVHVSEFDLSAAKGHFMSTSEVLQQPATTNGMTSDEVVRITRETNYGTWRFQKGWTPMHVVDAEGCYITDANGKRYLDFSSQLMCMNLGHKNQAVIDSIAKQAQELAYAMPGYATTARAELSKLLLEVLPKGLNKFFFTTSGTDANEAAFKIARMYTGKTKILARYRSYHGSTSSSIAATGDPRRWPVEPRGKAQGVIFGPEVHCYKCPIRHTYPGCGIACADYIEHMIRNESDVAAVLVEPIVGTNGVIVPPQEYMAKLRRICDENGVLLIADEVMSGWGRSGAWFAMDLWGVTPDILTTAKGITSAYVPLGLCATSEKIGEFFQDHYFAHGHTYEAHPMTLLPAVATINEMKRMKLVERAKELEPFVQEKLNALKAKHPSVGDVRGKGLFWAVDLVKDQRTKEPFNTYSDKISGRPLLVDQIAAKTLADGVIIQAWVSHFVIAPPLIVTREELERGIDTLDRWLHLADEQCMPAEKPASTSVRSDA